MKPNSSSGRGLRDIAVASRVFLAVAVTGLCAAVALLAYHQGAFTRRIQAYFYAGTADGMNSGMAVKLVGFKVGSLESISIDRDLRVKVDIVIDTKYVPMIGADATIRLTKESLIGGNILEIRPGSGDHGPITRRAELRYEREPSPDEMFVALVNQVSPIVADVRQISTYFSNPDSDFRLAIRNIDRTAVALAETTVQMKQLIAATAERIDKGDAKVGAVLDRADGLLLDTRRTLAVLEGSLKTIDAALPGIASKMDQSLDDIRATSKAVRVLANGELPVLVGEAGALVNDTGDVVRGARQSWPLRGMVHPRQELLLRLDSAGGLSVPAPDAGREK